MKILQLHADYFEYVPVEKEIEAAEQAEKGVKVRLEDLLVLLVSVERGDTQEEAVAASEEVERSVREIEVRRVLVYPYAHLSGELAPPGACIPILRRLAEELSAKGFEVHQAPFGWVKSFQIQVKGHPLAEQFKSVVPGKRVAPAIPKKDKFHKFYIIDVDGSEYEVDPHNWEEAPPLKKEGKRYSMLRIFIRNELAGRPAVGVPPKHVYYMRKLELSDYCPESDVGNIKWYPNGVLMRDLILDYAFGEIAAKWGAMKMQNPLIYRTDIESIRLLQGEFHERDYSIEEPPFLVLRFASDPGAFPFAQKLLFTYKHMPLKVYEEAICFRKEQKGEVVGLSRVRNFMMTDQHAFCRSEEEAIREYRALSLMFRDLMNDIASGEYWVLGFEIVEEYYERYRSFLRQLVMETGVPAFFKLMREMTHYYAFKSEYQAISRDEDNVQISTVQWDVKNGERFNICYVNESGERRPVPIILHASSFGSIERAVASMLEAAAWMESEGINPILPFWLAPEQVRVIPVNLQRHMEYAIHVCDELEKKKFRVGLDDRELTVSKRVYEAKTKWIPYILVIGEKEVEKGVLTIAIRESTRIGEERMEELTLTEFIELLEQKRGGKPTRSLYVPRDLSKRVTFTGVK